MSVRHAVLLIPEPSFTARAYRARQIICGQYGSWAAEMLMVHLMLSHFFPCPDSNIQALSASLSGIASESRGEAPGFSIKHRGVATLPDLAGTIFLDFTPQDQENPLQILHTRIAGLVEGVVDSPEDSTRGSAVSGIYLPLMQHANLSPGIFDDAVNFAGAVVNDLALTRTTSAWRLMLARFQSQAAGEDWGHGAWSADVTWELVSSYPL